MQRGRWARHRWPTRRAEGQAVETAPEGYATTPTYVGGVTDGPTRMHYSVRSYCSMLAMQMREVFTRIATSMTIRVDTNAVRAGGRGGGTPSGAVSPARHPGAAGVSFLAWPCGRLLACRNSACARKGAADDLLHGERCRVPGVAEQASRWVCHGLRQVAESHVRYATSQSELPGDEQDAG